MTPTPTYDAAADLSATLVAVGQGDQRAYAALWAEMQGPVSRLAARFLNSEEEGEDVAQECFLKIWNQAHRFDPERGNARAWIFAIARNAARDRIRQKRLRWLVGIDDLPSEPAQDGPGTEAQYAGRQELAQVQRALTELPDRQRMALLLATVADLDTPQIADIMDTGRGAIEQLLVRARRGLRQAVERQSDG